jgi:hypothetical protein
MAKASKTASKTAQAKTDPTKPTVVVAGGKAVAFDAQANAQAMKEERAARKRGEDLKTQRYTVADGKSVRKGGERYIGGQAIDLSPADADRLLAKGVLAKGKGSAAPAQNPIARSTGAPADAVTPDPDSDEAKAQREADEAAAAEADAAQQANGLPSGAENR